MIISVIGVLFNRCCNQDPSAPGIAAFTMYPNLLISNMRSHFLPEWTEERLSAPHNKIRSFNKSAVFVLGLYHPCNLGTLNYNVHDHIIDGLRSLGRLHFNDADI